MLFVFDKKNNVVLNPEAAKLTQHLGSLTPMELALVVLIHDYHSPLHQFDLAERTRRACRRVYLTQQIPDGIDRGLLEKAAEEYQSLQYDVRRETVKVYQSKIASMQDALIIEQNDKKIQGYMATIKTLQNEIKNIQEELNRSDEERLIVGAGKLTFLEDWKENQKQFKRDRERQQKELDRIANEEKQLQARRRIVDLTVPNDPGDEF